MKTAFSPTISEFNGMKILIRPKEPQHKGRAHIHVMVGDQMCSLDLPDLGLLVGDPLPSSKMKVLKSWVDSQFPEQQLDGVWALVSVGDRLFEDWMTIQNNQTPLKPVTEKPIKNLIPTPQEIANFKTKAKLKSSSFHHRAKIVKVALADKPFHLDVEFADGARKRIDIPAMYEGYKVAPEYKQHIASPEIFAKVQHDLWNVWWGDYGEESEIGHTDLYSAGKIPS